MRLKGTKPAAFRVRCSYFLDGAPAGGAPGRCQAPSMRQDGLSPDLAALLCPALLGALVEAKAVAAARPRRTASADRS
jgi:hypothetical protein